MKESKKIIITSDGGIHFFQNKDFHSKEGFLKKEEIEKAVPGETLETNTKKKLTVLEASFSDFYQKITRGPQIIPLKDVGTIIAEIGLEPDWIVVDAGTGSGALACILAHHIVKGRVHTFEIREDHINVAQKNVELLGLKNITITKHDVYEGIPLENIDLITLDLPEPWKVTPHAEKSLKPGGYLVSYSPCVPQVSDFVESITQSEKIVHLKTVEVLQREWEFNKRKQRPVTQQIGHSGFITFCRKIRK